MTLRELIYKVLQDDAKSAVAGSLGVLLAHTDVSPYGVYFMNPPKEPSFPLLTYFINAESGRLPRVITLNVTAWHVKPDEVDLILARVYTLLHRQQVSLTTATDFDVKRVEWNWGSPDMYDEEGKVYLRQFRFLIYVVKSDLL